MPSNIIYSFKAVWAIDKFAVFLYGLNVLLEKAQPFLYIFLPKVLLDELMKDDADWYRAIGIILVFVLAIAAANFIQRATYSQTSARLIRYRLEKNKELALKTMDIDYAHMENPDTLNKFNLAKSAVSNYCTGMEGMMREFFSFVFCIFTVVGYVSILAALNVFVVLALILAAVFCYLIKQKIAKINMSRREELESCDRGTGYYSNVMSDFSYGKEIRIYDIKKFLSGKYDLFSAMGLKISSQIVSKRTKWNFLLNAVNLLKAAVCYGYLLLSAIAGGIGIGSFLMYFGALNGFTGWIEDITASLAELCVIDIQVGDYRDFMAIPDSGKKNEPREIKSIDKIEFKNVWFAYPGTKKYILKNINLCIGKNDKLAVVGRNGEGKTTLIKLLCGLYEPTSGEILYNGIDLRELNRADYVAQLAVVFQTINIFAFSVMANVALCEKRNIDEKKVLDSLKSADVDYILKKSHNGLDMSLLKILDDEGIELSGGENQKIALARAIYKGGSVIVLDEPTAHLDALAEKRIYDNYLDIAGGKISVFISHRLASTKFCDSIVFLEDGEIAEMGPHDLLIGQKGKYAEMFAVVFATKNLSDIVSATMELQKAKLLKGLQSTIDQKIMEMDFEHIEDPEILDLRNRVMDSIHGRDFFYRMFDCLTAIFAEGINLVSLGVLISILNPAIVAILVPIVLVNSIFNKKLKEITFSWEKIIVDDNRRAGYFGSLASDFSIGKDSRVYGLKGLLGEEFDRYNRKAYDINIRIVKKTGLFNGLISINEQIQLLVVYIYIAYKVFAGAIGIGDFAMYVNAAGQFGKSIYSIMYNLVGLGLINNYIEMYAKLLNIGNDKNTAGKKTLDADEIHIEFRDVSFAYPRAEEYTLKNINIKIDPREKLSVIGENGAGKTTFIKLLCGLYKPTSGEILINGVNMDEYDHGGYIQKISAVFQDFKLFACSIKENVAFGGPDGEKTEKTEKALNQSGILEKINTLEHGQNTQLYRYFDENGIELSGGENQKLAISRAIYKNSQIIVLDEPTASLDPYAEYEIFSKLNAISEGKTVIFISHRLSSCKICDKIAVFHKGEIVQYGTHSELMCDQGSKYHAMYTAQSQYYE